MIVARSIRGKSSLDGSQFQKPAGVAVRARSIRLNPTAMGTRCLAAWFGLPLHQRLYVGLLWFWPSCLLRSIARSFLTCSVRRKVGRTRTDPVRAGAITAFQEPHDEPLPRIVLGYQAADIVVALLPNLIPGGK